MAAWTTGYVESNGIKMHYTRTGGNKPPVVLAHGFSDDGLCWLPVAEELAGDYDVIMVDARGHGRSEGPEDGYTPDVQANDLAGVIQALGLKRPAILGHSMGAATTLTLAGTFPDLPGAILLEDPPAWWMPAPNDAASDPPRPRPFDWIVHIKRMTREEMIEAGRARSPRWSDAELGPWADSKLRLSFNVLNRPFPARVDWQPILSAITCPALLITADPAQGAIVTKESAAALQELLPHAQVAHIDDAGHSIRRDQFNHYMLVVRAFLAEHAQGR